MSDWRNRAAVLADVDFRGCSGGDERLSSRVALLEDLFGLAERPLGGATLLDCGCGRGTLACVSNDARSFWQSLSNLSNNMNFWIRIFLIFSFSYCWPGSQITSVDRLSDTEVMLNVTTNDEPHRILFHQDGTARVYWAGVEWYL